MTPEESLQQCGSIVFAIDTLFVCERQKCKSCFSIRVRDVNRKADWERELEDVVRPSIFDIVFDLTDTYVSSISLTIFKDLNEL